MQRIQCRDYLQQIPAAKDKLTVLLVVVTPALEENSSFHLKTPTFLPVASCLHYHSWGESSGFSQKRRNCCSHLWSPKPPPRRSPMTAAVYSHIRARDRLRGDPVALFRMGLDWIGNKWEGRSSTHNTDFVSLSVISPKKLFGTTFSGR